jgi:hypothetical protein
VAAHLGLRLECSVDASVSLLHARGVPGDVEVEEVRAVAPSGSRPRGPRPSR